MAHIEVHAMSVKLSSTFEAEVYFPGTELEKDRKYPVIWFVHPDGTGPVELQKYSAVLEELVLEKKFFIIAPDISHSLCTDMVWGTYNEQFVAKEAPAIFRFMYPISDKKEDNYMMGIGSGAYGAIKVAAHYKDCFAAAIAINGELDIAEKCDRPEAYSGFAFQSRASLDALFGARESVRDSKQDIFASVSGIPEKTYLFYSDKSLFWSENRKYAALSEKHAEEYVIHDEVDFFSTCMLLKRAVNTVLG